MSFPQPLNFESQGNKIHEYMNNDCLPLYLPHVLRCSKANLHFKFMVDCFSFVQITGI